MKQIVLAIICSSLDDFNFQTSLIFHLMGLCEMWDIIRSVTNGQTYTEAEKIRNSETENYLKEKVPWRQII